MKCIKQMPAKIFDESIKSYQKILKRFLFHLLYTQLKMVERKTTYIIRININKAVELNFRLRTLQYRLEYI